jgi:hypothetical protein
LNFFATGNDSRFSVKMQKNSKMKTTEKNNFDYLLSLEESQPDYAFLANFSDFQFSTFNFLFSINEGRWRVMKTMIEGGEIMPQIAEIMQKWFIFNLNIENSYPESYVRDLGEIQDYFCRQLDEPSESLQQIKSMLLIIIAIKDDFKKLIPQKGGDNEE